MEMRSKWYLVSLLAWLSLGMGCAGHDHQQQAEVLPPPVYADSETTQAMNEGNRLFQDRWWTGKQYRIAIQTFPSLAEAHYNLGLTLNKQARFEESLGHFRKPYNWNLAIPYIGLPRPFVVMEIQLRRRNPSRPPSDTVTKSKSC